MMRKKSILNWTMFGNSPLIIEMSIPDRDSLINRIIHTFEQMDVIIDVQSEYGLRCILPARKMLGIEYRRRTGLECFVQIHTGSSELDTAVAMTCDISKIRRAKRTLFYALSIFAFALVLPQLLEKWEWTASLFLFLPLPIAEVGFLVDRQRLRKKLLQALRRSVRRD